MSSSTCEYHSLKLKNLKLYQSFPSEHKRLYPNERPDVELGCHLHFKQFPIHEKVKQNVKLSKGSPSLFAMTLDLKT